MMAIADIGQLRGLPAIALPTMAKKSRFMRRVLRMRLGWDPEGDQPSVPSFGSILLLVVVVGAVDQRCDGLEHDPTRKV
jgi:hypothetical protein